MSRKQVSIAASASERGAERAGARSAPGGLALSITNEIKQYGEIAAEQGKLALAGVRSYVFAALGAGDVVVTRAAEQSKQLAVRTQEIATGRVTPIDVRKAVEGYLQTAGVQAATVYSQLSQRGEDVVHELRKDPRVQRVIFRAERAVDTVEDTLEDLLDEVDSEIADAKDAVSEGAETTRATVRKAAARNTTARKSSARTAPAGKVPTRNAAARKAPTSKAASTAPGKAASKAAGKAPSKAANKSAGKAANTKA